MQWLADPVQTALVIDGLNCPPFGVGLARNAVQQAQGLTGAGYPYQTLDYSSRPNLSAGYGSIATMRLATALPPFFVSLPENPRPLIKGTRIDNQAGLLVVAQTAEYGQAVLNAALPAIREYARRRPLDLAIDGNSLTAQAIPGKGDDLIVAMEDLAMVAGSLNADPALRSYEVGVPSGLGWYEYSGWRYACRDDHVIIGVPWFNPSARNRHGDDVSYSPEGSAPPTVAFRHTYETDSTDSDGNRSTSPHSDNLIRCLLDFQLPTVGVGWRRGTRLFFGDADLEAQHPIYSDNSPLASAMIRPVAEIIAKRKPPPFFCEGPVVWFAPDDVTAKSASWCQEFLDDLLKQLHPTFWNMLGYPTSPYLGELR